MATTVLPTRDILWSAPYLDPDKARYGEAPSAAEWELRVAATPAGSGTLIDRITSVSQVVESFRTGRQLDPLQATASTANDANVSTAAYSATNPTGYSGNSLEVQATGGSSSTRGSRKTCAVGASDLSVFEGGQWIRLQRRVTSNTNLTRWVIRFEFATTGDWAEYELAPSGVTVNTWAEVVFAKGNPRATNGTVNWALWSGKVWIGVVASGAYTGNCEVRDLRMGTVQTAKDTPDGAFAWEATLDMRRRYRDNATAKATTTLAASTIAGATNVKYAAPSGPIAIGDEFTVETAGLVETRTVTAVGTTGAGGTGLTVSPALSYAHASSDAAAVYHWGPWTSWLQVKSSQPPAVAADTPADGATVTDPTVTLAHTYSSPAGKAQASTLTDLYRLAGMAGLLRGLGPASWWRLGEPSGSVVDQVGGVSGTASGGVTRGVTGLLSPADTDGALDLDGSSGYVTFGDVHDFPALAPFSLVLLVQPDALATGYARIVSKDGADGWRLWLHTNGDLGFERQNGAGTDSANGPGPLAIGQTSLVVATYDGARLVVHVDGVAGTPVASTRSLGGNANQLTLGRQANGAVSYYNGKVDELAVFSRALTAAEAAALQEARAEAYANDRIRSQLTPGTGLGATMPAFLLEPGRAYAWQQTAADSEGLTGITALRSFITSLDVPAAVTNLVATPDGDASTVTLTWDASSDPDLHHYRVYRVDATESAVRIDGGPAELDDGRTPLTANAFVDRGGRLGVNEYRVTVHDGVLESEPASIEVTLDGPGSGGSWVLVNDDLVLPLRVVDQPSRSRDQVIDRYQPPGRGSTIHRKWAIGGRRVSLAVQLRPSTDGDVATVLEQLQDGLTPGWLKAPAGWRWDAMWCTVTSVGEQLGTRGGGWETIAVELEETEA